ncbi:toxin co-regulated pilus biosynthesis Q family protein [Photorhabdus luminescens]|uniref:toxin co-regulated pilus biosynthesis Q family protein n=1 Tax=Photorhabdus luminescens TaxID=29488 RepID=UPI00223F49F7|nr:toxin co-regulated pilus biosynthesis Q family protein [Photorhabdus luminescens]MCW7763425.1 toxin co-regulated pilus biosynthesis Q family protein [Photorhabdus luminescens subsp. venezuelensis]
MKKFISVALAPVMLSGCAITVQTPSTVPAQKFVTTLIQDQLPIIKQAHAELAQVSRVKLNKPSSIVLPVNQKTKNPSHTSGSSSLVQQPAFELQAIRYIGKHPSLLMPASAGKSQTLRQAVTQILPVQWQQTYGQDLKPEVLRSLPLQWKSNVQWPYVLNQLMLKEGLIATIDWTNQHLSISKPSSFGGITKVEVQVTNRDSFDQKSTQAVSGIKKTTATIIMPKPIIHKKVWRIEAGNTLKDTIFNWSASEKCATSGINNWTVVWMTPVNYRIDAPLQFEGNYRDALNSLFTLYGTAKVPLYAGARSEQCVLSVDDKEIH